MEWTGPIVAHAKCKQCDVAMPDGWPKPLCMLCEIERRVERAMMYHRRVKKRRAKVTRRLAIALALRESDGEMRITE